VRNPRILGGEPTLEGTRVPVRTVVEASHLGMAVDEIVDAYPMLDVVAVETALAFYRTHREEIDQHIVENTDPVG
jgi:uncharacterized protein (DUF433 family)